MASNKKSVNLLPEYLKTDKNTKFLSGTLDPLIQTPQLERISGFVGSKITPNYDSTKDFYLTEDLPLRKEYSLEPGLVFKDQFATITDVIGFDDIINEINIQGGKTNNLNHLFRSKFYSYDPYIDWDKLVNYNQYYWLPNGPDAIILDGSSPSSLFTVDFIGNSTYVMSNGYTLSNGMKIQFGVNVTPDSYKNKDYYVEGVGNSIKLIASTLLTVNESTAGGYNETFDSTGFDSYSFDGSKKLPITPEYITINKASSDLNPWSRYNRWFHGEIIRITAEINNQAVVYPLESRAKRPIIEFKPDIQLYNFGNIGIKNIDVIDTDTDNVFSKVDGTIGYYVDGVLLEKGNRVIFNADPLVRDQIYLVNYDVATNPPTLRLVPDHLASDLESVAINYGTVNQGTSWHYATQKNDAGIEETKWWKSQQHTKVNQAPLFDLFANDPLSNNGISYSGRSSFTGSKIFGYDVGTGKSDNVLGFPLKYQNSVGVGSYLFKNYFMSDIIGITDSKNVTSNISAGTTYFKVNGELTNVWTVAAEYQTPIIEIQTIETATNVLKLTSLTTTATSVVTSVNSRLVNSTLSLDGVTVTISSSTVVNVNDTVSFEITANGVPNKNGFYKTPLGLTNNPLNGPITDMTLSELSDHLSTMVTRESNFSGIFPGASNLRDLIDYSKYGTRLIINANLIAFSQIFLGKKEHNVVDSIRQASDQYNQFKMNLLRSMLNVDTNLTPADALDQILTSINSNRDSRSPYYNSDMLGYGGDRKKISYTVSNPSINTFYATGVTVDLTKLNFQSLLVYLNNTQLIVDTEYTISGPLEDEIITINVPIETNDIIDLYYYADTRGSYIPSTPTKLGLWPKYEPAIFTDASYLTETLVIQCHDGSIIKAYGDYRDDIILEFEKRIYNNIKITYNPAIFDMASSMPGAFRKDKYSLSDATSILATDFIKWTGAYNIDSGTNNVYDEGNYFTWNYSTINNDEPVPGFWRGLFKYYYDTDRPNTHPWEMLGFTSEPDWWFSQYGSSTSSDNINLWSDLEAGFIAQGPRAGIQPDYARPGLSSIIPVNDTGNLKDPLVIFGVQPTYNARIANWQFGDQGPAETAWRRSSYWPFAANVAAALLDPCSYTSLMYDVSRITLNPILNQVTYSDNLYINPSKLKIEGESQIAGYGVYVVEHGKNKDLNYVALLKQDLSYIDFNLFHKLGGFASKDKLQVIIDSVDPISQSQGAILPPEDYTLLLNVSNPIKSASISGVIIQKFEGKFIIKGYDKTNPYFEIFKPLRTSSSEAITIGGKSASFTEWTGTVNNGNSGLSAVDITSTTANTSHYYKQGQIVRYNGKYYIVKIGHTAQPTFNLTYFQGLPSLPMTGGATVETTKKFESTVTRISYGTSFSTIQDVYDVLVGYGAFLENQGFIFDEYNNDLGEIVDWKFTGKEFLFWSTQNWADGNLITLSPFSDYLKYSYIDSIVDNISTGKYEYSLLKADGTSFPIDKFRLSREDGVCTINTIDTLDGMFFATLNSVQKEHAMVFNNSTIFNDTIYDIETGYRQRRIKLSGFRTANWNGDLSSPGFVYDSVDITDWIAYKTYLPGKVVRYNGSYYESNVKIIGDAAFDFAKWAKLDSKPVPNLLPNFDYKIDQFEDFYSLDIDNFDAAEQQLAQHLIGYTPRTYLNNIFSNSISQYKFYQGFIREKGTKGAIDKLSKVGKFARQGDITFNEDWAFRVGNYGSFNTYKEIEFTLDEATTLENPVLVKFVNSIPTNANPLISYVPASSLLLTPDDYTVDTTFTTVPGTLANNNLELTNAGYVRSDDVTITAYNKNSLLDIANNELIQEGNTIWLGFLENGDWGVRRYSRQTAKIAGVYISSPATDITFSTDINHGLSVGDIVSVVKFNEQVNGIHIVTAIPRLDQFTVASTLSTIVNADLLSYGTLFKFENARYDSLEILANSKDILKLKAGEKIWIDDGVDNKWQVYEKIRNYSLSSSVYDTVNSPRNQHLGQAMYTSDDTNVVLASSPGWKIPDAASTGSVRVYTKNRTTGFLEEQVEYALNTNGLTYCSTSSEFGYSLAYDHNKGLYFTGAPAASNVRGPSSTTGVVIASTGNGNIKSYAYEGLVEINSFNSVYRELSKVVLVNPYATTSNSANHARFGHSIYINQPSINTSTTLLIGAPGDSLNAGTGKVYAYSVNSATVVTAHGSGINLNSHVALTVGSQFGHKIAGNTLGNVIAISAPYYVGNTYTGVVQLFDKNLSWLQTITSPFGTNDAFGDDVTVSPDGKFIFISSSNTKVTGEPYGKVAVYNIADTYNYDDWGVEYGLTNAQIQLGKNIANRYYLSNSYFGIQHGYERWGLFRTPDAEGLYNWVNYTNLYYGGDYTLLDSIFFEAADFSGESNRANTPDKSFYTGTGNGDFDNRPNTYSLHQIISNPLRHNELKFGTAISISKDNNTLVISALGVNSTEVLKFDQDSKAGETIFDSGTTQVINYLPDAGSVYVYNNLNGYFIEAEELFDTSIISGSKYGNSVVATNLSVLVGAPTADTSSGTDNSRLYQFNKIDSIMNSWNLIRQQDNLVDVSTVDRIALIDSLKEEVIEYLDVIDPAKGKIAGIAEQELKYKSAFDPATYTIGLAANIVDASTSWIDEHVGELWWDLSTTKYMWYEQGDDIFRKNNWGKLFPGSTIDVFEWVKSDLLPSEWAAQADTNEGLTKGISGQPKYPDNSAVSIKQVFNNVTNAFENVYFFWVKNKVTVPSVKNRRISGYQVSNIIADPVANGLKFAEIISSNSVAFANIQPMLVGNRINSNIAIDTTNNEIPKHTEWVLLAEGNADDVPTALLEKKLIDSLLGHDDAGRAVPTGNLTYRNRYGLGIRPQQTLFKDRIQALRNLVDFTNSILIKNRIVGNYSFDTLNSKNPISDPFLREYDFLVEDFAAIDTINDADTIKYSQAIIECFVNNGKITAVDIISPGYGYSTPPKVTVVSNTSAELLTEINSDGEVINVSIVNPGYGFADAPQLIVRPHTVIVNANENYNGIWTEHKFDYAARRRSSTDRSSWWVRIKNQTYDTTKFWNKVDWSSENFKKFKNYAYVIPQVSDLASLTDIKVGDYVKVNNVIDNGQYFIILEKLADTEVGNFTTSYNIVFSEKGTIQISDSIWNFDLLNYSYDISTLDGTLYDQIPDLELFYILTALKNDIFIGELRVNWNLFFFAAVKYALTEQKLLDWAFKTSFINVTNVIGSLDQRSVYQFDNEQYFEDYIKEIKPYHSQIRTYTSKYNYLDNAVDGIGFNSTDFDLPAYFNTLTNQFDVLTLADSSILNQQPWKSWADNYTSEIGYIDVATPGTRYTQRPTVTITGGGPYVTSNATGEAYLRNGGIYQILVTNPGAGYTQNPIVTISGGGPLVTTTATASARLLNLTVRKNTIGIKFDRVNAHPEIGKIRVTDTFICSGSTDKFVLTWLAETNKLNIEPTLDGKLVLSSDYKIEYYTEEYNGYNKRYSRFLFLNYVPLADQVFKISYNKNINLYTAVDRIDNLYTGTSALSSLITGTVYPGLVLQGLPFDYSIPWDTLAGKGKYDVTDPTEYVSAPAWSDLVSYYTSAKLTQTAQIGASTLYLNTTTGIFPGQVINILNSPSLRLRTDTVVTSVNTSSKSITISKPSFKIIDARSTATTVGSKIVIRTVPPFNGGIYIGDKITLSGITSSGYNGSYTVSSILDADQFTVNAITTLSTTTSIPSLSATAVVTTLLTAVSNFENLIDHVIQSYPSLNTRIVVKLNVLYSDIAKIKIFKDGLPNEVLTGIPITGPYPGAEYYQMTADTDGKAIVSFYQMYSPYYSLEFFIYGNPTIEFWKPDTLSSRLDTAIDGGSWNTDGLMGALGVDPEDMIVDGDSFLNIRSGYAPEELIEGNVADSLGVNVYTKSPDSHAMVISGAFPITTSSTATATLSMPLDNFAGVMIHYNGKIFDRLPYNSYEFTTSNQYYIVGNTVYLAPQSVYPGRAGYTLIGVGGDRSVIDSNLVVVNNTTTAMVESLASVNDIRKAYVLVDGNEINPLTDSTPSSQSAYVLTYAGVNNKRAAVSVVNLTQSQHTIEAWFFESVYTNFNRVHEELFTISNTLRSRFTLTSIPGAKEPVSDQTIVELGVSGTPYSRKRLLPPLTSYYEVRGNQVTFAIDNKHEHPTNTYNMDNVRVYVNGVQLRPGFDYTIDGDYSTITVANNLLNNGDALAITGVINYEYVITGNLLELATPVKNTTLKVTSFTNHDNMMIKTERFDGNAYRKYVLSFPALYDNYVWVYVDGIPLTARYDFEISDDLRTIQLSDSVNNGSTILITTVNPPSYGSQVLGFRVFNDIFNRSHYKRLSSFYSTTLSQPLHYNDSEIYVTDASKLIPPNPLTNKPGVVLIDGERIEFLFKDGNILRQLRRSTLGTGPAIISNAGTTVLDQSLQQTIETVDSTLVQTTSTTALIYVINTVTNSITGDGIKLTPGIPAIDQISVYYGGRQLRKSELVVHDPVKAYDTTSSSISILPPEFSVDNDFPTTVLVTEMVTGDHVQYGSGWVLHENADTMQIQPGWIMQDANGYKYTVIVSGHNSLFNGWAVNFANAITITWPLTFIKPAIQQLTLNVSTTSNINTNITIIQKKGQIWTGTESLLTSEVIQARFMREHEAALPNKYYYGG